LAEIFQCAVLGPFQGVVEHAEDLHVLAGAHDAQVVEVAFQILSAGQLRGQAAEDQMGASLGQQGLELLEHVGRGEVHALHPPHVENDGAAALEVGLQLGEQPIGGAGRTGCPAARKPWSTGLPAREPLSRWAGAVFFDEIWWPPSLRRITELRICSRMKSIMARANPTPAAAIRL